MNQAESQHLAICLEGCGGDSVFETDKTQIILKPYLKSVQTTNFSRKISQALVDPVYLIIMVPFHIGRAWFFFNFG